jgi:hypothetical protein
MAAVWIVGLTAALLSHKPAKPAPVRVQDVSRLFPKGRSEQQGAEHTKIAKRRLHPIPTGPIPPFCRTGRSNPAEVGPRSLQALVETTDRMTFDTGRPDGCLEKDKTNTQIPFAMCLLGPDQDDQVRE